MREYQKRGTKWLLDHIECGFGSILADDMGLGKTLQVLAAIKQMKNAFLEDKDRQREKNEKKEKEKKEKKGKGNVKKRGRTEGAAAAEDVSTMDFRCLVVCPTSVVANWK